MKKILAALSTFLLVASLVSCGDSGKPSSSADAGSGTTAVSSPAATTSSKATDSTKKFSSVKDYVESPDVQKELEAANQTVEAMGMTLKVTGDTSKMVYTYTYKQQLQVNDEVKNTLKTMLDGQKATFTAIANVLKSVVDVDNPSVVLRYLNADGTEILSQEFKAE